MAEETYEAPQVTVLGNVTDLTQKHGNMFDYGYATQGSPVLHCGPDGAGCTSS
jgi:hypothetical protein